MINRLIKFLTKLPTPETSPLRELLNTTEAQEDSGGPIKIYSSHSEEALREPYVILQKIATAPEPFVGALGTGGMGGLKSMAMTVKCVAKGADDDEADERSELLADYAKTAIEQALTELNSNEAFRRQARGAAAGRVQKIQSVHFVPLAGPAPGNTMGENETSATTFQVNVRVSIS